MLKSGLMAAVCGVLWCAGCSPSASNSETVTIDKVPASLVDIARKELPDVNFTSAYKFEKNGEAIYEIRGKNQRGKICEVEVSASGKVLEIE